MAEFDINTDFTWENIEKDPETLAKQIAEAVNARGFILCVGGRDYINYFDNEVCAVGAIALLLDDDDVDDDVIGFNDRMGDRFEDDDGHLDMIDFRTLECAFEGEDYYCTSPMYDLGRALRNIALGGYVNE